MKKKYKHDKNSYDDAVEWSKGNMDCFVNLDHGAVIVSSARWQYALLVY